jgi:hypothetical protein
MVKGHILLPASVFSISVTNTLVYSRIRNVFISTGSWPIAVAVPLQKSFITQGCIHKLSNGQNFDTIAIFQIGPGSHYVDKAMYERHKFLRQPIFTVDRPTFARPCPTSSGVNFIKVFLRPRQWYI